MKMKSSHAVKLASHFHADEVLGEDVSSEGICRLPSKECEWRAENSLLLSSEVN